MCVSIPKNYYYDKKAEKEIHSPHKLRVNGMFMNSDKIADIWNCPKKNPMNPKKKCNML